MAPNPSIYSDQPLSKYLFRPYRLLETVLPSTSAGKIHDGTATSFLDAMVDLGDNPCMESVNAILSSFDDLKCEEQDKVLENPKYWNSLAKWGTEEDREELSGRNVERLRKDLENVIFGVGTRKTAAAKDEAARLLATIPENGKLFRWTRAMVCKENSGNGSAAGREELRNGE